jgi:hypothetical protein
MNGKPLLSEAWRDIMAVGSLVVTVVGFVLAIWQIRKTKSAALAARDAARHAYGENRDDFQRYVLACGMRFWTEAKIHVEAERWDLATIRLRDLADQVSQLADSDPAWRDILAELRRLDTTIGANPMPKFSGKKWSMLMERLQTKIDAHYGPYKNIGG